MFVEQKHKTDLAEYERLLNNGIRVREMVYPTVFRKSDVTIK